MVGPAAAPAPAPVPPPAPAKIAIDDFRRVELRVARILEATDHANANKLLVLKVDAGGGDVRQVVSGIKQWYTPADLVGKMVILVANLNPAVIRGVESNGMVLAASSEGSVILLSPEKPAQPGSKVS